MCLYLSFSHICQVSEQSSVGCRQAVGSTGSRSGLIVPRTGGGVSRVRLCATPWTVACQAPLSLGLPRQEYWNGSPCHPPGDLPDPGISCTGRRVLYHQVFRVKAGEIGTNAQITGQSRIAALSLGCSFVEQVVRTQSTTWLSPNRNLL